MNRLSARQVSALLVLLLFLAAAPAIASAQGRDITVGTGRGILSTDAIVEFGFAASSDADGNNARGHIVIRFFDGEVRGYDVVCLRVFTGNKASIGGLGPDPNEIVLIFVEDNGGPGG